LAAVPRLAALIAFVLLAALGAGCGSDEEKTTPGRQAATTATQARTGAATTTRTAPPERPARCLRVARPKPKGEQRLPKPTLRLDPSRTYEAVMDTSCGSFTITLDVKSSPETSASFVSLARRGFYDNLTFHRIVPGFVIQGGDPLGNGQGGPGYTVVEAPPGDVRYTRGVVAMAKTEIEEPGTSGSQFYVVTAPDAQLPADYAVLGKVTQGMNVVERIALVPTDQANPDPSLRERPRQPVVIRSVTITERR
jgi:cyclophilin family peptidyl-prolyl cis-trans isomerase